MRSFTEDELLAHWFRNEPCPDCAAPLATAHTDNCDVAHCRFTGLQRISCEGIGHLDCGAMLHDGYWPGERDCARLGWYLSLGDTAHPDLNRLITHGVWNRQRQRWEEATTVLSAGAQDQADQRAQG